MEHLIEGERYEGLIRRLRAGDPDAAAELVGLYEPEIRREVRTWLRLRDPRPRRLFDSVDVCQSVLASFFFRTAVGEYDLDRPEQLVHLLVGIARNKLSEHVKHHQRQRRDVRRVEGAVGAGGLDIPVEETPSQEVAGRELIEQLRRRLSDEERQLADLRAQGADWAEVAARLGGTAEARRKQLQRAVERVEIELGLRADGPG
jgi:RNA polymerase sigma-70 factor (ECF subfamily)